MRALTFVVLSFWASTALADDPESPVPSAPVSAPVVEASPRSAPCMPLAPDAYLHNGFYFRFGTGAGYTSIVGTGSAGRTSLEGIGSSASLLLGGTPGRGFVVGGGMHITTAPDGVLEGGPRSGYHVGSAAVALGPFVDWYPDPHDGWHVGALAGLGGVQLDNSSFSLGSVAFGGTVFGGYDWWIGPQWSLGLFASASAATSGPLTDNDGNNSGYRAAPLSFALEASLVLH